MSKVDKWDGEGKAQWRKDFWAYVGRVMPPMYRDRAHVAILPGKQGLEIPLIREIGIPERNIHAVDRNPAIIASAKWRDDFPDVRCYGVSMSAALPRIVASIGGAGHELRVLNLDLCSNLNAKVVDELTRIRQELGGRPERGLIMGINCLKGRESPMVPLLLAEVGWASRAEFLLSWVAQDSLSLEEFGDYRDGPSPMTWGRGVAWGVRTKAVRRRKGVVTEVDPWRWTHDGGTGRACFWGEFDFGSRNDVTEWVASKLEAWQEAA